MNCLKTLFSGILLLLVVFQFNQVQAIQNAPPLPIYEDVIEDIALKLNEKGTLLGRIRLSSGLVLQICDYQSHEDANTMKTWQAGDRLKFDDHISGGKLFLGAQRLGKEGEKVEPLLIVDPTVQGRPGLIIDEIGPEGEYVKLSDHSVWKFGMFYAYVTRHWKPGERVLVHGGHSKNNRYEFINIDVAPIERLHVSAKGEFVMQ